MTRSSGFDADDELVERLRAKYSGMTLEASQMNTESSLGPTPNTQDGPTDGAHSQARICGSCEGSGQVKYQYHFREMLQTCKHCDGEGLLGTKKVLDSFQAKHAEQTARTGGTARVMSLKQRERANVIKSQISRLERKIGELEAEKVHYERTQQDAGSEQTRSLLTDLMTALDSSLATLYRSKRNREDHLSYYDDMEEPSQEQVQA